MGTMGAMIGPLLRMQPWSLAALVIAMSVIAGAAQTRTPAQQFQHAVTLMEARGEYGAAIELLEPLVRGSDRRLAARALLHIGLCYEALGRQDAANTYQRLLRDFGGERESADEARARLAALGRADSGRPTLSARRVWAGSGVDAWSALSSDGRFLTFPNWDTSDLGLLDLNTGESRSLTRNGSWFAADGFAEHSVHAPDGRHVAFVWIRNDGSVELRLVGVDGTSGRVLHRSEDITYLRLTDWSSDGRQILATVERRDGSNQIVLFSIETGAARTVKSFNWRYPEKMSFSPDGRHIVYDLPPDDDSLDRDIFVVATDGSRHAAIVAHPANDYLPVWSPDGRQVVFASDRTGAMGLWSVSIDNGDAAGAPRLLRPEIGRSWPLRFATNGRYYYAVQTTLQDVYTVTLDARGAVRGTPAPASRRLVGVNRWPEWSPDGRLLAWVSQVSPGGATRSPVAITIRSVDSGEERTIAPRMDFLLRLRWSRDGRALLAIGADARHRGGLYTIDAQTGTVTPVMQSETPGNYPRQAEWASDGTAIFYKFVGKPIMRLDLATGREVTVHADVTDFRLSPDNRWLAITYDDRPTKSSVLAVVPVDGHVPRRELVRAPGSGVFSLGLSWTPDAAHVLFTRPAVTGEARELWRIPATGGEADKLVAMEGLSEIRVHPDGRRIAFSAGQFNAEIWVMENLVAGGTAR